MSEMRVSSSPAEPVNAVTTAPRTLLSIILGATFRRWSARIGLVWLILVAIGAIFGTFIANSHPYVMKTTDGELFFPLFRHLRPIDVVLPCLTFLGVGLMLWRGISARIRVGVFMIAGIVVSVTAWQVIQPPQRIILEEHRELRAEGVIAWSIPAPIAYSPRDRQRDLGDRRYIEPSITGPHFMGTESDGADVFSGMIHACRIAMAVGFIATGIALVIGITIGGIMGYFAGWVDLIGMRLVEIFSAIPSFFLILTLVAVMPPHWNPYRLYLIMVILGVTGWVGYARFVRAEFLKLRKQDYVQAAIALGLPLPRVLFRHMLPNGVAPVLVEASFGIAGAILTEAFLSFLGLGLVDEPSWGRMLSQAVSGTGSFKWWMAVFPGGAIFLTVFAYNLIGEALRDAIDPHTQKPAHL